MFSAQVICDPRMEEEGGGDLLRGGGGGEESKDTQAELKVARVGVFR